MSARRIWLGIGLLVAAGTLGTVVLVRHVEERAWRRLVGVWEGGLEEYRDFYADASLAYEVESMGGEPGEGQHWAEHGGEFWSHLREMAVWNEKDLTERGGGARWHKSKRVLLGRMPTRTGLQSVASLTLEVERSWFHTALRAHADLIEKDDTDPRWDDALARIFEGSEVELTVEWRGD